MRVRRLFPTTSSKMSRRRSSTLCSPSISPPPSCAACRRYNLYFFSVVVEEIVLAVVVIAFVSIVVVGSVDSSYCRDRGSCGRKCQLVFEVFLIGFCLRYSLSLLSWHPAWPPCNRPRTTPRRSQTFSPRFHSFMRLNTSMLSSPWHIHTYMHAYNRCTTEPARPPSHRRCLRSSQAQVWAKNKQEGIVISFHPYHKNIQYIHIKLIHHMFIH